MSRPSRTGTHSSARPRLTKLSYRVKCQASSGSGWCFKRSLSCDDFWQPKVRTTDRDITRPLGRKCPNLLLREWWIQLIELLRQNSCSKADIIIIKMIIIIIYIYILYICHIYHYIIESWNVFFFHWVIAYTNSAAAIDCDRTQHTAVGSATTKISDAEPGIRCCQGPWDRFYNTKKQPFLWRMLMAWTSSCTASLCSWFSTSCTRLLIHAYLWSNHSPKDLQNSQSNRPINCFPYCEHVHVGVEKSVPCLVALRNSQMFPCHLFVSYIMANPWQVTRIDDSIMWDPYIVTWSNMIVLYSNHDDIWWSTMLP